jgi:hypothetical protein
MYQFIVAFCRVVELLASQQPIAKETGLLAHVQLPVPTWERSFSILDAAARTETWGVMFYPERKRRSGSGRSG